MRKRLRLICPLLTLLLLLTACTNEEHRHTITAEIAMPYTVADAQALLESGAFSGEMERVDEPGDFYVMAMFYHLDEAEIRECACYMAADTSVSADEVTVLVLKDEAAAQAAEVACQRRAEDQIEQCKNYCPDQVPKLEDAVILRRQNTVLFAVGDPDRLAGSLDKLNLN